MGFRSLDDVLHEQVMDLLSAEKQLVAALPKVAAAAHSPELKQAIKGTSRRQEDTREAASKDVKGILGMQTAATTCKAMQGLVAEGEEVLGRGQATLSRKTRRSSPLHSASSTTKSRATALLRTLARELDHRRGGKAP